MEVLLRRRSCVVCGEPFTERGRLDRMYCANGGCRTLAWKQRRQRKTEAGTGLDSGAKGSPTATYPDYAPHGTLVQLAQRLEAERISAQRALQVAQQRIAELEKTRWEGAEPQPHQHVENPSFALDQTQSAQATQRRLAELERELSAVQQENALLQNRLQAMQHQHARLQTELSAAQLAQTSAEEREQAAEVSATKANAQLLALEQTQASERQQSTELQSRLSTVEREKTEAVHRAESAQRQAKVAEEALERTHAQHDVDVLAAALHVRGTEDETTTRAWLDARHKLLHRVAVTVARDAQQAVADGETDRNAIAMRALDWTRGRILFGLAAPQAEEMRALFQAHRPQFCRLAGIVTVRISTGTTVANGMTAASSACSHIAHRTLDRFGALAEPSSGEPSDLGNWVTVNRLLLLDFCQRVVARARFASATQRAVTASEVTARSLSDIGWRYFDQPADANRWEVENRAMLERLTTALLAAS